MTFFFYYYKTSLYPLQSLPWYLSHSILPHACTCGKLSAFHGHHTTRFCPKWSLTCLSHYFPHSPRTESVAQETYAYIHRYSIETKRRFSKMYSMPSCKCARIIARFGVTRSLLRMLIFECSYNNYNKSSVCEGTLFLAQNDPRLRLLSDYFKVPLALWQAISSDSWLLLRHTRQIWLYLNVLFGSQSLWKKHH